MRFVAGRGTVAESHREAFAGRGTVAERLQRGGAMAEHLLARGTVAENHREAFAGQRRRGGAAGRECHGEEDGGTVAESYREAFAGRGAVAERLQRGGAMTELLLARALQRSSIGKKPLLERGDTVGKENHCQKGKVRSATAGKKGLQGATGWSLFLMRPLCKLFLYL